MQPYIDILLSGLLIGILVSAPMGPVGMLCIQRTLNKGRWSGFCTGIGAGLSDLCYCLVTGLCLSMVQSFIERHSIIIQIIGSVVLIAFACWLFNRNPAAALKKPSRSRNTFGTDIATGFLFTASNPLIIFFIIGLFGRFNFLLPEYDRSHYIAGYSFIFTGTIVWWYIITFFVNKVRAHFNVRSMWLINRIIGSIILLMALYGIYGAVKDYYNNPKTHDTEIITPASNT
ncbi:MAG: LysE family translocator [Muribaculaceae bacterium]|nr:LysE family translocator [Muribaculaceae bacterium]MDE6831501.1 LysE family translocator [Muribaculaceae bacterium]